MLLGAYMRLIFGRPAASSSMLGAARPCILPALFLI